MVATQDEEVFGVLDLVRQEPSQREVMVSALLVVATPCAYTHRQMVSSDCFPLST